MLNILDLFILISLNLFNIPYFLIKMLIYIVFVSNTKLYDFGQSDEKDSFILIKELKKNKENQNIELRKIYITDKK